MTTTGLSLSGTREPLKERCRENGKPQKLMWRTNCSRGDREEMLCGMACRAGQHCNSLLLMLCTVTTMAVIEVRWTDVAFTVRTDTVVPSRMRTGCACWRQERHPDPGWMLMLYARMSDGLELICTIG